MPPASNQATSTLRQHLKSLPWLVQTKRNAERMLNAGLHPHATATINQLPLFAPDSWGSPTALARLTIQSANQTFPFLAGMIQTLGVSRAPVVISAEEFGNDAASREAARLLKEQFIRHGSDKSSAHNYHPVYGRILKDRHAVRAILEIGMGTNNTDVVSHMGRSGRPGASLRAFRDFLPQAKVFGADIDRRILFEEDRIQTFFVDQTDPASFDAIGHAIGHGVDLIIDDGLHSPNANIAVLAFGLPRIKPGGWVLIEDIIADALPVWQVVAALLPPQYDAHIIDGGGALMFAVQRRVD
ncbi:hypothetical protein [Lacisediminimonas sp.]|uniref:hypothetical protein n=1 Tax=Lacisediminimonas sp. TaxID=3060582 RepID=UPI00271BCD4C|nr:hypothetical protein [Lacisediminimonas sp.]MDO8300282.1 hypothetical protein [Lacisediminimonas sp.]